MTTGCPRLALLAALAATACSSYNRASVTADAGVAADAPIAPIDTPTAPPDTPAVTTDTPAAATDAGSYNCERMCGPLRALPRCVMAATGCSTMCGTDLAPFPAACATELRALFACIEGAATTSYTCTAGAFPYSTCMEVNGAALRCVSANR